MNDRMRRPNSGLGSRNGSGVLSGDLGTSFTSGKPVTDLIFERMPITLSLTAGATLIGLVAPLLAGSAVKVGGQDCHAAVKGAHTGDLAAEMLADLGAQETASTRTARLRRYVQPTVLVVDEVGYLSYSQQHADLLFEPSAALQRAPPRRSQLSLYSSHE